MRKRIPETFSNFDNPQENLRKGWTSEPLPLQRLIHRCRPVVRALIVFVMTAFLLANLATAASDYVNLSCCPPHPAASDAMHTHTSGDHHAATDADNTTVADDACCSNCDRCNTYYDAHFNAVGLVTDRDPMAVAHLAFPVFTAIVAELSAPPPSPPPQHRSLSFL